MFSPARDDIQSLNAELFSLEPASLELASHAALLLEASQLAIRSSAELKPPSVSIVS